MRRFATLYRSSIGKKVVMAVTGAILFGFVVVHLIGNLKVYQGADKLNHYAEWLREMGGPILGPGQALWLLRIGLIAAVVLHVTSAIQLTRMSHAARPVAYRKRRYEEATYASRTMRWGGVIIVLFVTYHLLHLTLGTVHPTFQAGLVYENLVAGFQVWWVSAIYILTMVVLGLHMHHGLWSALQTVGSSSAVSRALQHSVAAVVAWAIALGNISMPVAVLAGVIQ